MYCANCHEGPTAVKAYFLALRIHKKATYKAEEGCLVSSLLGFQEHTYIVGDMVCGMRLAWGVLM